MQLQKIKISNILSFPYVNNFDDYEGITFDIEQNGFVNVLIGPNGSGKSNFLIIINNILKTGFMMDYTYNPEIIRNNENSNFKNVITRNEILLNRISKHFSYPDKESKISIKLKLNNNDIDNIGFISKYRDKFKNIINKYSNIKIDFQEISTEDISKNREIELNFDIDITNQKVILDENKLSEKYKQIINYIKNIELIQICIMINNEFESKNNERKFYPLKNTFSSIGLHRNFLNISDTIDPKGWNDYISAKHTLEYPPFIGYYLCINKIRNILNNTSHENIDQENNLTKFTPKGIEDKLKKSEFFMSLDLIIKKYFNKKITVGKDGEHFFLYLVDNIGQNYKFENLSNGEQSLLIIIFAIYGFDLKDGLLIIDEPEIHFHPQMQKDLIKILEKIGKNIGTQFIISTYSPLFINESNISNVYRFTKIAGETNVIIPGIIESSIGKISDSTEGSLIQMLKFDNASKIFFSDKIIMVEGETDAYFLEFYLNYLHTLPERKEKIKEYEVININGKGGFKRWKTFLSKFGLNSYFIGDWDNTVEFNILQQSDLAYYYQESKKYYNTIKKNKLRHDRHYTRLVNTVRELYPQKHKYIIEKIEKLYKENLFILKRGDIETYLGMKTKGLEDTIKFCHRDFQKRLTKNDMTPHRIELNDIIRLIFP